MKTRFEVEYNYKDGIAKKQVERMLNADEAWIALYKIKQLIWESDKQEQPTNKDLQRTLEGILEEISETRLEQVL